MHGQERLCDKCDFVASSKAMLKWVFNTTLQAGENVSKVQIIRQSAGVVCKRSNAYSFRSSDEESAKVEVGVFAG